MKDHHGWSLGNLGESDRQHTDLANACTNSSIHQAMVMPGKRGYGLRKRKPHGAPIAAAARTACTITEMKTTVGIN
jgi:hypothetical protein